MSRTDATIGAPYDERARKPDTGYKGTRYIFDVYFDEYNGPSPAVDRLTEWYVEGNTERGKFKDGRIGIRNNYRPKLNVTPLYESGYKFVLFELLHDLKYKSEAHARIILEYSGTGADSIT